MTVLGAVVFGGFLLLAVLWLLVTAPDSEVDESQWLERSNSGVDASNSWALTHLSQQ
jgi:hypothetical protein